jgi:GNAT superfamily N-acetyltransferase
MRIYEINQPAELHISAPAQIPEETLYQIADLIASGSEVNMGMVERNLQAAESIAWADVEGQAVGAIVLKHPVPGYKEKVFTAAGVPELARRYQTELGYTYVDPAHRSRGTSVQLGRLMMRNLRGSVFATTREENTTINKLLTFIGFKQLGEPYTSSRGDYRLFLWVNK